MGVLDTNKPFYRMEILEPGGSQTKFVISPNIFLDTELPSDTEQATPDIYLTSLNINSSINGDINICELKLQHSAGFAPAVKLESKIKVYLGYYYLDATLGAEYSLVFTGNVSRVVTHLQETLVECRSELYKLTSKRKKITYGTMLSLDEIINKLAINQGGLVMADSGIAQTDINKQPGFAISDNKSLLDYIKTFAQRASLHLFMDVYDKFHAAAWAPGDLQARTSDEDREWLFSRDKTETSTSGFYKHELEFGKDIIACDFEMSEAKYSKIKIIGFKTSGDDPANTIDPPEVEFTPTEGADAELPVKTFKISHITREDAEKVAENLYYALNQNLVGKVVTLGSPQIRLGDGVKITGTIYDVAPYQSLDFSSSSGGGEGLGAKVFQVLKVNHRFNNEEGFVTRLELIDARATPEAEIGEGRGGVTGTTSGAGFEGKGAEFTGIAGAPAEELRISITNAQWNKEEARQGDIVTLTADVEGAPDGTAGEIEIYEHDVDGIHDLIKKLPITVFANKIETTWEYEYHEDTDEIPTDEELKKYGRTYNPPEYFFVVKIDDTEDQSGILLYKDYVEIILKNRSGEPIADEEFILTLPDGTEIEGKVDSEGYAKVEGIPPGKVTVRFPKL